MSLDAAPPCASRQRRHGGRYYIWNRRLLDAADDALFEPEAWAQAGRLSGQASGRGAAYFLRNEAGTGWVLRHSRRGGIVAHISDDSYLWLGLSRSRVFREFRLLAELHGRDLPVPEPVAARVVRRGLMYRGDLITVEVPNARPLADWLADTALPEQRWQAIGATIARFHHAGVYHHDLNARNILLDADGAITLIDFDKSALRRPGRWCRQNLARLRRSLDKIAGRKPGLHFRDQDWRHLQTGYHQ